MLVKDGVKKSYILGGILQVLLGIAGVIVLLPLILLKCGIRISGLIDLAEKIIAINYVLIGLNLLIAVMFIFAIVALFMRRSFSSTFFKLATITAMFPFAVLGLENGINSLGVPSGATLEISKILTQPVIYALLIASGILCVLGFLFHFTVSKQKPKKATTYQMAKALLWIIFLVLTFVINTTSNWVILFSYSDFIPYFFGWYFLVMGIWQFVSSPKLVDPEEEEISTGYPMPYGQVYPTYPQPPVYPQGYNAYPPAYPPYPYPPANPNGLRQGLSEQGIIKNENLTEQTENASNQADKHFENSIKNTPETQTQVNANQTLPNLETVKTQTVQNEIEALQNQSSQKNIQTTPVSLETEQTIAKESLLPLLEENTGIIQKKKPGRPRKPKIAPSEASLSPELEVKETISQIEQESLQTSQPSLKTTSQDKTNLPTSSNQTLSEEIISANQQTENSAEKIVENNHNVVRDNLWEQTSHQTNLSIANNQTGETIKQSESSPNTQIGNTLQSENLSEKEKPEITDLKQDTPTTQNEIIPENSEQNSQESKISVQNSDNETNQNKQESITKIDSNSSNDGN